jgi:hypothetical protein
MTGSEAVPEGVNADALHQLAPPGAVDLNLEIRPDAGMHRQEELCYRLADPPRHLRNSGNSHR